MKKILMVIAASLFFLAASNAQDKPVFDHSGTAFVAVQGGLSYSVNENYYTYRDAGAKSQLFQPQAGLSVGYWFNPMWGARLSAAYGTNRSALNFKEVPAVNGTTPQFCPYGFKSVSVFADAMIDVLGIKDQVRRLRPIIFGGIGFGHSYGLGTTKDTPEAYYAKHWQRAFLTDPNNVFAFRFGGILEYTFPSGFSLFGEISGEAYTDSFNGLKPTEDDKKVGTKNGRYAGMPLDCRAMASFGVAFHF